MIVNITDFAESRNIDRDTVNAYIRKHPEIQQYVSKEGKHTVIDTESEGYKLLEKQYPLPQLVQIVEDKEARDEVLRLNKELENAHKVIIRLTEEKNINIELLAKAEANQLLLVEKSETLSKTEEKLEKAEAKLDKKDELIEQMRAELEQARKDVVDAQNVAAEEKAKTWWQKLWGK